MTSEPPSGTLEPAKLIIEVVAGVVPNVAIYEYTKRWSLTASEAKDMDRRREIEGAAVLYTLGLHIPSEVNWVRQEWIWL